MNETTPQAPGLGAPPGLGCPGDGVLGPLATGVWSMLAAGSPRLALAKAMGIPLAPYFINVIADVTDTAQNLVAEAGSDVKIYQDTLVDSLVIRTLNLSPNANQNQFQAQSDFYYGIQSGILATLDVQGAPRYSVAPKPTPLSTLADMINSSHWPGGWVLTYQQQLAMTFTTSIALPYAPIRVICTFRAWIPVVDTFEGVGMTNRQALDRLQSDFGVVVPAGYRNRPLR